MHISALIIAKRPNWRGNRDEFAPPKVELLIFKQIHSGFVAQKGKSKKTKSPVDIEPPLEIQPHKEELLSILQALPPDGFERMEWGQVYY